MSKKLAAKAGLIQLPPLSPVAPLPVQGEFRPKTAPGAVANFMVTQSAAVQESERLRGELKAFEGASLVRELDPMSIRASKWANRHPHAFLGSAFEQLKREIADAGGNVQPIRVRTLPASGTPQALNGAPNGTAGEAQYEIVFGHRRHRACLELGIPVSALIEEASDQELFVAMERENRGRENLSAWEQGMMYRRALDEGLYPSMRQLAEAVNVDVSQISKSVSLARLPEAVVGAFASPQDLQFRWAQPLADALQKDPDGLLDRARKLKASGVSLPAAEVLAALLAPPSEVLNRSTRAVSLPVIMGGRKVAAIAQEPTGRVVVRFEPDAIPAHARADLPGLIEALVASARDSQPPQN